MHEAKRAGVGQRWIYKPTSSGEGRGVAVANTAEQLVATVSRDGQGWRKKHGGTCVVQPLLESPLLVLGRKFDIRLYVLVTSTAPLRAYLYREGLVRLAAHEYGNGTSRQSWITNTYVSRRRGADLGSVAWSVDKLFTVLTRAGHRVDGAMHPPDAPRGAALMRQPQISGPASVQRQAPVRMRRCKLTRAPPRRRLGHQPIAVGGSAERRIQEEPRRAPVCGLLSADGSGCHSRHRARATGHRGQRAAFDETRYFGAPLPPCSCSGLVRLRVRRRSRSTQR